MKVYVVQSTAGVIEGVYSSEEKARAAFTHWSHLELRKVILNRGAPEYPFSSPLKPEDRDDPLPGSFTFQCGSGEMGTLYWSKD
jgi:hypothetical protein